MTIQTEEKAHAKRSPSGAKRRMLCPGSVVVEEGAERSSSRYSAEGTAAHTLMELALTSPGRDAEAFVGRTIEADGYEFEVDMAMADAVNLFIAHIISIADPEQGATILVENEVPIGHITGEPGGAGTADVIALFDEGRGLLVADLKYGRGVPVYASYAGGHHDGDCDFVGHGGEARFLNEQLAYYALGALEVVDLLGAAPEYAMLMIGQPRLDTFDAVTIAIDDLRSVAARLRTIEQRCDMAEANRDIPMFAEAHLYPGEDQCRFCEGKRNGHCPALLDEVDDFVQECSKVASFSDLDGATETHVPAKEASLAELMARVPLIEDFCRAIRAKVEASLFCGGLVEGWKLVQGKRGNRAWSDEAEAEAIMKAARLRTDAMFSRKLISPTQAEKLLKDKPRVWSKLEAVVTQSEGQPSVAPESDKRPALTLASAQDSFNDLDGGDLI